MTTILNFINNKFDVREKKSEKKFYQNWIYCESNNIWQKKKKKKTEADKFQPVCWGSPFGEMLKVIVIWMIKLT